MRFVQYDPQFGIIEKNVDLDIEQCPYCHEYPYVAKGYYGTYYIHCKNSCDIPLCDSTSMRKTVEQFNKWAK